MISLFFRIENFSKFCGHIQAIEKRIDIRRRLKKINKKQIEKTIIKKLKLKYE